MVRIYDAGERLDGRREAGGIPTSGTARDVLKLVWPKPDFAAAAKSGQTTPERAALFEAIYRNLATRPAPLAIAGVEENIWPKFWRSSIEVLQTMWETDHGNDLAQIRRIHDGTVARYTTPDLAAVAALGSGRAKMRNTAASHGLDLHPAFAASARWLPRIGWPDESILSFDEGYAVMEAQEGAERWWQPVAIAGRSFTKIGSGARHATEEAAGHELAVLSAKLIAAKKKEQSSAGYQKALGPGGVRIGPDNPRRSGCATSQDLVDHLGMKGVEFGQGIGQRERQEVCNLAFDAFFDLCSVLRLPARAASLWGRAGIAFGSRGLGPGVHGHFDAAAYVVHMDGWSGAGVLAHEMGHAIDCMLAEASGLGRAYLSEGVGAGWRNHTLARMLADVYEAMMVGRSGAPSAFLQDSKGQDRRSGSRYWATPVEMFARSFECWVFDALAVRKRRNDFLVSRHAGETVQGLEWRALASVYPKGNERRRIVGRMDEFLKVAMPLAEGRLNGTHSITE
jgi:hypothetical protein